MELSAAREILIEKADTDYGKYYSTGTDLDLGAGQIYTTIRYPLFDSRSAHFDTVEGIVYVVTHECDIDQRNRRPFNDLLLVLPILPLEDWLPIFAGTNKSHPQRVPSFLGRIARREVSRVAYLPPTDHSLPYGGLIYFNQMAHTHVSLTANEESRRVCTLTQYGLEKVDQMIADHLLRPKANILPLARW